ncbi:hypothetical protein M409DRAFT_30512 [Zasmidium cellare ATCC 36951]|uniref:Enoyl reductase (ER) domain-containing protein n=1 Tax=Zasmidium cellare ATCC 36951 TaxID=1080233 RepID=A0A6A6BY34_ZASCE|nr:uncharacterized protein M409DRAFT_30512 [Zasmidium cellare ATCC 36951]KAF2158978.1 hypothetical protein M409DRAFT_30512 [Zasmidium cellare ATCC 36951]
MPAPSRQSAVVQWKDDSSSKSDLPILVRDDVSVPKISSPHDVLVRVVAASGNPTDWKMITHFYMEGNVIGCDFCGVVVEAGSEAIHTPGTKICGAVFPYRVDKNNPQNGAFAQWVVADSRQMLALPDGMNECQAAALGAIGWGTVAMALGDSDALNLSGTPTRPVVSEKPVYVLVYGGATATGVIAIQMLKSSGYHPIAVCSQASAARVKEYGAIGTADYTSPNCTEQIKTLANGFPIKHALDCITDDISAATCFSVLSRTGARYACLEDLPEAWRTRKAVKVKIVMGFEMLGHDVDLGHASYARAANASLHAVGITWAREVQWLLDNKIIKPQLVHEVEGGLGGLVKAVEMMRRGEFAGKKLVARLLQY